MDIKPSALLPPVAAEICVLDDDASMLRAIDRLLSSAGLEARLFSDAARLSLVCRAPFCGGCSD